MLDLILFYLNIFFIIYICIYGVVCTVVFLLYELLNERRSVICYFYLLLLQTDFQYAMLCMLLY